MGCLRRFCQYFEICNFSSWRNLALTDFNKNRSVQRYCNCQEMRRFLKKFTEGNMRNSRLISYVDVTKIRKTRVVQSRMSKIRAQAITPACT